jgi:hypothetical protein
MRNLFESAEERETREIIKRRTPVALRSEDVQFCWGISIARSARAKTARRRDTTGKNNRHGPEQRRGLLGENAGWLYLDEPKWVPFEMDPKPDAADLADFIDVKCREKGTHMCIYPANGSGECKVNPDFAYICAVAPGFTRFSRRVLDNGMTVYLCGWMWGRDVLERYSITDKMHTGRPCYWVPEIDLYPMPELREINRRRAAGRNFRVVC